MTKRKRKRNMTLTLDSDTLAVLEAEAEAEHRSVANLILHVVSLYLEGKPAPACSVRGAGRLAPGQPCPPIEVHDDAPGSETA